MCAQATDDATRSAQPTSVKTCGVLQPHRLGSRTVAGPPAQAADGANSDAQPDNAKISFDSDHILMIQEWILNRLRRWY